MADFYRKLLATETDYFTGRISEFTSILDELTTNVDSVDSALTQPNSHSPSETTTPAASPEVIESVIGRIRLAIGQSNLFINERFRQFNGLIEDCEAGRGEKKILVEDLAGFWDMINYQVEDLKNKYAALEELRRNGWIEPNGVIEENGGAKVNGSCKSNGTSTATNGTNGTVKRNGVKTSLAANGTSNGSNGHVKKAPTAVRSNIREFLKSKRKEVVKDPEAPIEPIIEFKGLANGKTNGVTNGIANGNGALANSTAHHLNGL